MKLLYDQNLAPGLVTALASLFPESRHVSSVGLDHADDLDVWNHARSHGFTIVSKDSDFMQMSFLKGAPPKVVWIRRGYCSTKEIGELLKSATETIKEFGVAEGPTYLILR